MRFAIYLVVVLVVQTSAKPSGCPRGCSCDRFEDLRQVRCTNQNFWSIGYPFPRNAQVVDVSYNQISELGNYHLLELDLRSLKLLNVSHNKLAHIHINAFRGVDSLKTIDLSYNALEYLLPDWFYDLPNLKELYFGNNNFAKLPDSPFIDSKSLRVLDLSTSRIPHLGKASFSLVPNLEKLYLNGNLLMQLNVETISSLKNLRLLSLKDNPLACDSKATAELRKYCKKNGIRLKDSCATKPKPGEPEKFQRMVILEELPDEKNSWISEDEFEDVTEATCQQVKEDKGLLMDIIELSPILALVIPFVVGCVLGMIVVCSLPVYWRKKEKPKRHRRFSIIRRNYGERTSPLVLHCEHIDESTPVPAYRNVFSDDII